MDDTDANPQNAVEKQSADSDLFNSIIQSVISKKQLPMFINNESIEKVDTSLVFLCKSVKQILLQEDTILDLESPIKICGDIHGQLDDLIKVICTGGFDGNTKYLFLGDYIDRGPNSLEVICLLYALKCAFPTKIYLLRGNHESPEMAESFGFAEEVETKINDDEISDSIITAFYDTFDCLPISAMIDDNIFCVHGGLSPDLDRIEDLLKIKRPLPVPEKGIVADLLWSDPDKKTVNWGPNERGVTFTWGEKIANDFIQKNKLSMIIRAHQIAQNGIDFPFFPNKSVITVFSATNYLGTCDNVGAFIEIEKDPFNVNFTLIKNENSEKKEQNAQKVGKENCNENSLDTGLDAKINENVNCRNQNNDCKNFVNYNK